jgi:hypothetical protein
MSDKIDFVMTTKKASVSSIPGFLGEIDSPDEVVRGSHRRSDTPS